jgi:DNA-binding response OmpR family regulator
MLRIMIAEADLRQQALMEAALTKAGYGIAAVCSGAQVLKLLEEKHVDMLIMGLLLPDVDGLALLRSIREQDRTIPILVTSSRQTMADKRQVYTLGADDFLPKPYDMEELLLKTGALLRRARIAADPKLEIGQTVLYQDSLTVMCAGMAQELPKKEFMILYKLLSYNNRIFTRRQLMAELWDRDTESDEHTVDVHINRLRDKFRDSPDFQIITMRGLGYKAVYSR